MHLNCYCSFTFSFIHCICVRFGSFNLSKYSIILLLLLLCRWWWWWFCNQQNIIVSVCCIGIDALANKNLQFGKYKDNSNGFIANDNDNNDNNNNKYYIYKWWWQSLYTNIKKFVDFDSIQKKIKINKITT